MQILDTSNALIIPGPIVECNQEGYAHVLSMAGLLMASSVRAGEVEALNGHWDSPPLDPRPLPTPIIMRFQNETCSVPYLNALGMQGQRGGKH